MPKKARPGGNVQIKGRLYAVVSWPEKRNGWYALKVRHEDGTELWAEAPIHQCGKGPWKISAPVLHHVTS